MSDDLDSLKEQIDALKKQVRDLQSLVEGYVFVQKGIDSATQGFSGSQLTVQEIVIQGPDGTGNTVGDIKGNQSVFGSQSFVQTPPAGTPTYMEISTMLPGLSGRSLLSVLASQGASVFSGLNIYSPQGGLGAPGQASIQGASNIAGQFTGIALVSQAFGISIQATNGGDGTTQGRITIGRGLATTPPTGNGIVQIWGDTTQLVSATRTPASSADPGNLGEMCIDQFSSFVYFCTPAGWRRATLAAF